MCRQEDSRKQVTERSTILRSGNQPNAQQAGHESIAPFAPATERRQGPSHRILSCDPRQPVRTDPADGTVQDLFTKCVTFEDQRGQRPAISPDDERGHLHRGARSTGQATCILRMLAMEMGTATVGTASSRRLSPASFELAMRRTRGRCLSG